MWMAVCVVLMLCFGGVEVFEPADIDAMPWSSMGVHVTHDGDAVQHVGVVNP